MIDSVERRRLFFALWPDDGTRAGIVARRELLGPLTPRQVPNHNLHLTLLFLGNQPAGQITDIQEVAGTISASSMNLCLDRFGWFPRAGVVWLGGDAPDAAQVLVEALTTGMRELGLDFDTRPFVPHVTLFRKVRRRPDIPEIEPLEWPVREFALIESIPGKPYQVLRKWRV